MALLKIVLISLVCVSLFDFANSDRVKREDDPPKKRCDKVVGKNNEAKPGEYPSLVSIHKKSDKTNRTQYCAGVIVSDTFILTAARCGYLSLKEKKKAKPEDIWIVAGDFDLTKQDESEQKRQAVELIFHDDWDATKQTDDLMLIKIEKKINMKKGAVEIAELSKRTAQNGNIGLTAAGWGTFDQEEKNKKSNTPRKAQFGVVDNKKCEIKDDSQFCGSGEAFLATNSNICTGDEGTPLFWSYSQKEIIGIASRPFDRKECLKDAKAIFTRIDNDWIEGEIE